MELNVCPGLRGPTGSWRPGNAQLGRIIENRLDEAYVLSWPGPLEIYVPVHDTGGYDRARAPFGSYDWRLDQVKGTASIRASNQVEIGFNTPALWPRPNLDFTFLEYDLPVRDLADPAWLVPSEKLDEVCAQRHCSQHQQTHWVFRANRSGKARDPAARYQVAVRELAAARGWSVLPPRLPVAGVSRHPVEVGSFFERSFDARFLEAATGDQVLMAAEPNIYGRHRLAFSKESGRWCSIAIHGSAVTNTTSLIQANIHTASFFPHPRHYVLVQHYDRRSAHWHEWSWLIRSTDFAELARGKGAYLLFTTTLNPQHRNRWTPYRIPTAAVGTRFRDLL